MTIFTSRLTKGALLSCLWILASCSSFADNSLQGIKLEKPNGDILKVHNVHIGSAPDRVNVRVLMDDLEPGSHLILEVIPVVGMTDWVKNEGITDVELLAKSQVSMPAFYSKKIELKGNEKEVLEGIDVREIIKYYAGKHLWPSNILFKASLSMTKHETDLSNNFVEISLPVTPVD